MASIRRFYPRIPVLVVDDSASPLDPAPTEVTRYVHEPHNTLGLAGGRNFGLRPDRDRVRRHLRRRHGLRTQDRPAPDARRPRDDAVRHRLVPVAGPRSVAGVPLGQSRLEGTAELSTVTSSGASASHAGKSTASRSTTSCRTSSWRASSGWARIPGTSASTSWSTSSSSCAMKERGLLCTCLATSSSSTIRGSRGTTTRFARTLGRTRRVDEENGLRPEGVRRALVHHRDRVRYYYPGLVSYAVRNAPRILPRLGGVRTSAHRPVE